MRPFRQLLAAEDVDGAEIDALRQMLDELEARQSGGIVGQARRDSHTVGRSRKRGESCRNSVCEQLPDWGDTLAAVLAHSLWQGLLVSLAVLIVLRTVPARHASLRYLASVGGLVAVWCWHRL